MPIVSRRHIFRFYLSIIFGVLIFSGLGLAAMASFIKKFRDGTLAPKNIMLPVLGLGTLFMAGYTVYRYHKNAPKIVLTDDLISVGKKTYALSEITKLELTGKRNFRYLFYFPMEATTLYFADGTLLVLFDDMYENAWEIKSGLEQRVLTRRRLTIVDTGPISRAELQGAPFETFKNNQFLSLRGLLLWGFIGFTILITLAGKKPQNAGLLFLLMFILFWFALHSWLMNYFMVSDRYFLVRSHIYFWKRKAYRLTDIREIVFETRNKMPNCLRVITWDFKSRLYPAGTLWDKTWLRLKESLESHDIKVRNECI